MSKKAFNRFYNQDSQTSNSLQHMSDLTGIELDRLISYKCKVSKYPYCYGFNAVAMKKEQFVYMCLYQYAMQNKRHIKM